MEAFKEHLIKNGLNYKTARRYKNLAIKYNQWLKEKHLNIKQVKRSQFTDWLQTYREKGFGQSTIDQKENIIKQYYDFLGTKKNPAINWIIKKDEFVLPPPPIEKSALHKIYEDVEPMKLIDYRNRCMLGFVIYQGLKRIELEEMRISDVNFETGIVFVQGQRKSKARRLKLEPLQKQHLQEYVNVQREQMLTDKKNTSDKLFVSYCNGANNIEWVLTQVMKLAKRLNPQVINLYHIRTSVISHWRKEYGLMEAMILCGHQHVKSTKRYETIMYDELHEKLKSLHPMENF